MISTTSDITKVTRSLQLRETLTQEGVIPCIRITKVTRNLQLRVIEEWLPIAQIGAITKVTRSLQLREHLDATVTSMSDHLYAAAHERANPVKRRRRLRAYTVHRADAVPLRVSH